MQINNGDYGSIVSKLQSEKQDLERDLLSTQAMLSSATALSHQKDIAIIKLQDDMADYDDLVAASETLALEHINLKHDMADMQENNRRLTSINLQLVSVA